MDLFASYEPRPARPRPSGAPLVRPAGPADAEVLAQLVHARHGGDFGAVLERMQAEIGSTACLDAHTLQVAEWEGQVVGLGRARHWAPTDDAPPTAPPSGFYLLGVIVDVAARRRGVGHALTDARLRWIAERAEHAWYFVNARNHASINLHAAFGFEEVTRDFAFPGVTFEGGEGILFRATLRGAGQGPGGIRTP